MLTVRRPLLSMLLASAFVAGCGEDDDAEAGAPTVPAEVATTYAEIVHATYADSLTTARALDTAINAFVDAPTAETLQDARDAWRAAREPYLQSEVFRFYGGPIDDAEDGPEGLINAWPLDEAYIDYVVDMPDAGLVQSDAALTTAALIEANEAGGEENIATGYHAIEFLLWGQDMRADGPGDRPASDYVESMDGPGQYAERRALYLTTVSALLVSHLEDLTAAWAPDQDNYRKAFEGAPPREALRRVMTGMIVLSGFETGGERLQTALDSASQEDEHSCFSDNT
ncbi:MAG: iron-regulated protein, partial [Myxococcales bacterium]|nr:iron-regulated protein [Myxococcales bacterium]